MKIAPAADGAVVCLGALVAQGVKIGATVEFDERVTIMATHEVAEHTGLHTLVWAPKHNRNTFFESLVWAVIMILNSW